MHPLEQRRSLSSKTGAAPSSIAAALANGNSWLSPRTWPLLSKREPIRAYYYHTP